MNNRRYFAVIADVVVIFLFIFVVSRPVIRVGFAVMNPLIIALTAAGVVAVIGFMVYFTVSMFVAPNKYAAPIAPVDTLQIVTLDDCLKGAEEYRRLNGSLFAEQLDALISQIGRIQKKRGAAQKILGDHFQTSEMSYATFMAAIEKLEELFILSVKTLLHRLSSFDDNEYASDAGAKFMGAANMAAREELFGEHRKLTAEVLQNNETILLKYDKLSLELSKLSTMDPEEVVKRLEINEIDRIIHDAKYYKT